MVTARAASAVLPAARACEGPRRARIWLEGALDDFASGFWIGENKCNKKRGDSPICKICGEIETVTHTFCLCKKAQPLWDSILKWWKKRTSEDLPGSPRVVLLGLREDDPDDIDAEDTQFSELTLPFTYLRTHTIDTLKKERQRIINGLEERTNKELVQLTLRELQKSANALYGAAKEWDKWNPPKEKEKHTTNPRTMTSFMEAWVHSGLAIPTKSASLPIILRAQGH